MKNLYVTVPIGQSVRDFLLLGTVDRLLEQLPDFRIVLFSPSYNVPQLLELCPRHERLFIRRMELPKVNRNQRLIRWRLRLKNRTAIRLMLGWEASRVRLPQYLASTFQELPPHVVVSTHPKTVYEYEIVMRARRLGVQTLGVVKSWDNIGKGLSSQPHLLSVWNPVNKEEASRLLRYRDEELQINGSPSFDVYYDPAYNMPRDESLQSLGLDPTRRVITLATGGVMDREYLGRDETFLVDDLLKMSSDSEVLRGAQLVIRLHANSRLEYFTKYLKRPDVRISFTSYMPGTMWCPSRQDLVEQINLLRHSDVIVTPGSSWALEAAILDTPTVVPVYSSVQPEHAAAQLDRWTLVRHFKPLVQNNWVPVTRCYDETVAALEDAFTQPGKYAAGRQAIVNNYVYYRDSDSRRRVVDWIAQICKSAQPGRPRGM